MQIEELVSRAQDGDLSAYNQIVRRFQDTAVGYAYSRLRDFHLAEDAAQEAFVAAYLDLPKLQEPKAFPGWLRRIVFNLCGRVLRRNQISTTQLSKAHNVAALDLGPAELLDEKEQKKQLAAALAALPEREGGIAVLYYMNQLSQGDIAEFMELSLSTVNNCLRSARRQLKEELTKMAQENFDELRPSNDELFVGNVQGELETLKVVHGELAATIHRLFSDSLRRTVVVDVESVTQVSFAEFIQPLPHYSFILSFELKPLKGIVLIAFSLPLVFSLVHGPPGSDREVVEEHRAVSPEEAAVLTPILAETLESVKHSWESALLLTPDDIGWSVFPSAFIEYPNYPQAPDFKGIVPTPDESVFSIGMTVSTENLSGTLKLSYPTSMIRELVPKLRVHS